MAPAASLALLLMLYLGLASCLLGYLMPGYAWRRDSLSHLGQSGARLAHVTNLGLFLPIGAGCFWLALQAPLLTPAHWLSACLAAGYIGAVIWPLRPQAHPANRWHHAAGAIEYLGGSSALIWGGWLLQSTSLLALALLTLIGITLSQIHVWRLRAGQWQRLAEASLFLGQYLLQTYI